MQLQVFQPQLQLLQLPPMQQQVCLHCSHHLCCSSHSSCQLCSSKLYSCNQSRGGGKRLLKKHQQVKEEQIG